MKTFALPDLGEGLQEAEIVAWRVAVGDEVSADDPLVSVETDKAVVEIPSPRAGRIARLMAGPGEIVRIGDPLVEFEWIAGDDTGTVVGEIADSRSDAVVDTSSVAWAPRTRAVPAVRRLARKLGVDLSRVAPSGPEGLVTRGDVEDAAAPQRERPAPSGTRDSAGADGEALRGVRRAMARNMSRAHTQVVPATVTDEADVGDWSEETDPMIRLIRAVIAGCRAEPALNARYDGDVRTLRGVVDLGIAVDTSDGLFVPVLRDVGALDDESMSRELERLRAAVAARTIAPEDLRSPSLTLSNFGRIGGRHASLVVLPPQVAIVGAGRIAPRAVAAGGVPSVRRTLPISVTFDHRVVTGGEAARFLMVVLRDLEAVR